MLNRNQLTFVLLAACAVGAPISFATGEGPKPLNPLGTVGVPAQPVLPAVGIQPAAVGLSAPAVQPVNLPVGAAPVVGYSAQAVVMPVVPGNQYLDPQQFSPQPAPVPAPSAGIMPAAQPTAPVVLPSAPMQQQVQQPDTIPVRPGENPFARSPQSARAPAPQPASATHAQPAINAGAGTASPAATGEQKPPEVDETALRYYGQTRDFKRLGAELRRLKALYPGWEAPQNIFDAPTNISEQPIWDLFAAGNYAGAREAISRMQSETPSWTPSEDLSTKLATAEVRTLLERSYAQRNWREVITLAETTPQMMVCGEMNAMWLTAEALAYSRDYTRAFELYKHILTNCDDAVERQSTIQKADLVLPEAGVASLLAFGRTMPDGTPEFENLSYDRLRLKMGKIASGTAMMQIAPEQLQSFGDYVQRTGSAKDAALFGWFYYGQQNWQASYQWFVAASYIDQDAKNIEGIVLSLRNLEQPEKALELARQYAVATPELKKIYTELVSAILIDEESKVKLDETEIDLFATYVEEQQSPLGAQALGWYRLRAGEIKEAKALFTQSVDWEPTEGGVVGLAVMASRAKAWKTVTALKAKYGEQFAALDDIKVYRQQGVTQKKKRNTLKQETPNLLTRLFGTRPDDSKGQRPRAAVN